MPDESQTLAGAFPAASPARRFTVRDAMILIAAAAVGVLGYRVNDATMVERGFAWGDERTILGWMILGGPGLAALTAGLVVVRLISPRPSRVELFRQPGFVATCVALALSARRFLDASLSFWLIEYDDWFLAMEWDEAIREATLGIVTAWTVMALAGCFKAEGGWIDRASRALAMLWVVAGIASRLLYLVLIARIDNG
jgi:hypothetical protein